MVLWFVAFMALGVAIGGWYGVRQSEVVRQIDLDVARFLIRPIENLQSGVEWAAETTTSSSQIER